MLQRRKMKKEEHDASSFNKRLFLCIPYFRFFCFSWQNKVAWEWRVTGGLVVVDGW
jgi:hypothetical protein